MTSLTQIRINSPKLGFQEGIHIEIVCDDNGTPLNHFWRKRFKDAQIDNCVTVISRSDQKIIHLKPEDTEFIDEKAVIETPIKSSKKSDKK